MATRVVETYGNDGRPGYNVKFWTYAAIEIYETSATAYRLRYAFWVNANGNLGTLSTSWGMSGRVSGSGNWLDSGWIDAGWYSSGQTLSISGTAGYTGGSGTHYSSTVNASYTVPQLTTVPQTPSSATLVLNDDNTATLSWAITATSSAPITQQRIALKVNEEDFTYTIIGANDRSYTFNIEDNSKYYLGINAGNNVGWGEYRFAGPIYTNPLTPIAFATLDAEQNIVLNMSSNSRYFKQFNISYETESGIENLKTTQTTYIIPTDVDILGDKLQVQEVNLGDKTSEWYEVIINKPITIWVNIPEGATAKSVWVKGPFKNPAIPTNVRFAENPNLPNIGRKALLLSFTFSGDKKALPEYFNVLNTENKILFSHLDIPYEEANSSTLTQNQEDGTYTYHDDGTIAAMAIAVGLESPYQLGVSLGNEKGESASILSLNNSLGEENHQDPFINTTGTSLNASAALEYYWCYISLDDKTYNNLDNDPVTIKLAYKGRSESEFKNEKEFTAYEIRDEYNQIYINPTQIPTSIARGIARIIISNSIGESEPYEVDFEI